MGFVDLMSMARPNLAVRDQSLEELRRRNLLNCIQCMKCTSGCTALKLLELKPHEIVKLANLGFVDELSSSETIWTCVTCLKCIERCPQKASPYHLIMTLRNVAVKRETRIPDGYLKAVSQILETGLADSIQKVVTRKLQTVDRSSLGLRPIDCPRQTFQAILMKTMEEP